MKVSTLTIFLALTSSCAFAQDRQVIDSLKHELAIAKHDTSRVIIMAELCSSYRSYSKPDSAVFFGEKGIALAEKINFPKGIIRNTTYYGRLVSDLGNLPKSLALILKALQIAKNNNLIEETGLPMQYLAGIYAELKEYSKAIMYYKQAKKIYETYPSSPIRLPSILATIGSTFIDLNQLDSATYYAQQSYDMFIQRNISVGSLNFRLYAKIQAKLGKNQLAIDYFHKGLELAKKTNNLRFYALYSQSFAEFFQKTNQLDSCIYYAKKGLEAAQLISYKRGILENSSLLAEIYDTKDAKEALRYYKLANTAKESLFGAGNIQAIQTLIAQEEARQKEIEDAKLAYENQLRQYGLLAGLALLLLVAFFLYRNNQKERKSKILLQEKNEEIQKTNSILKVQKEEIQSTLSILKSTQAQLIQSEKLASLGELTTGIAHEIQNPLNFVNNFSELSVELAKELKEERLKVKGERDEELENELVDDLIQNQEKINLHGKRASSIVKGMLEHSRTSSGVKELTDINKLADEYLRLSYHGLRAKDNTFNSDFQTDFDENLPKIEVIPQDMGRVLLNLINNAFWAVNSPQPPEGASYLPKVTVKTKFIADANSPSGAAAVAGWVAISVSDNGTGMTQDVKAKIFQPFFTTKPTGQGTGLGLSLAYDIVTKGHGGTIEVESVEGEGTTFIVKLPI